MKRVLSILIMSAFVSSASAGLLDKLRDSYLYSDTEIEGVDKSYDNARVFVPGKFLTTTPSKIEVTKTFPVVLYLHGCDGLSQHDYMWGKYIADLGYIVIQPDSLARPNTKVTCNTSTYKSDKSPIAVGKALMFRQQEIRYALQQLKLSDWVDTSNIFLMGHSQGGISTALNVVNEFKGEIISGWTCTHPVTGGIKSDKTMPVLAMAYDNDPWRNDPSVKGRCADQATSRVNFTQLDLVGASHGTVQSSEAQQHVSKFLKENTNETFR